MAEHQVSPLVRDGRVGGVEQGPVKVGHGRDRIQPFGRIDRSRLGPEQSRHVRIAGVQALQLEVGLGLERGGQVIGLQVAHLVELGRLAVAVGVQIEAGPRHHHAGAQERQKGIGQGAVDRLVAALPAGDPAQRDGGDGQDDQAVLARQGRQRQQKETGRDQPEPQPPTPPLQRRQHEAAEPRRGAGREQYVLPDDARIDQPARDHRPQSNQRRGQPGGARGRQHHGRQSAVEQGGVEDHEQGRAADDAVEQAQQPRHDRRVPEVVDASTALGELQHRVVGHVPRQVHGQGDRRREQDRQQGGKARGAGPQPRA